MTEQPDFTPPVSSKPLNIYIRGASFIGIWSRKISFWTRKVTSNWWILALPKSYKLDAKLGLFVVHLNMWLQKSSWTKDMTFQLIIGLLEF